MKPIVIETKKSDSLPIAYICSHDGALLAPPPQRVVQRLREHPIELAPPEEEVDPAGAEVVDDARPGRVARRRGAFGLGGFGGHSYPRMKLTK